MSSMNTQKYFSTSLTLLTVACTIDVEQAAPSQTQSTAPEVQESAIVETLRPEDLLRNGRTPFEGDALLVGGQPTPAQLERAHELGYKTVINLRRPEEEGNTDPEQVRRLGMAYLEIPIAGSADMTEDKARALAAALESADSPVIVHCASGNRVGGLFAMKAFHIDTMSPEEALAVGKAAGMTRLEPTVREKLGLPVD
jgi:uncharacterized protein (TIGR01244 family)